jgi:8-amino-7-oxononanoate synthase
MSLRGRWLGLLNDLREQGRHRSLRLPAGIDFTSNDYLGYSRRPPPPTLQPITGTASRLLRGHHAIWEEVESRLAAWHGGEAVLMMTSGYNTNEGLLATIAEPGDWVASDERCHASIIDGLRLARCRKFPFRHNDLNHLEEGLKTEAATRPRGRELFIVTEALFSMEGDLVPLADVVGLAQRHGAHVIVDEAHSTGCFGPDGSGCVDLAGLRDRVLTTVHTGGKALGLFGAYICGSALLKEYLVNRCRHLIFTTALPPAVGGWWLDRLDQIKADEKSRAALHRNAAQFRESLAEHGIRAPGRHYIVPVIVGPDEAAVRAAAALQEQGYDVRAIRPPTVPHDTCRLRISIHADHDRAVLVQLAGAVARAVSS